MIFYRTQFIDNSSLFTTNEPRYIGDTNIAYDMAYSMAYGMAYGMYHARAFIRLMPRRAQYLLFARGRWKVSFSVKNTTKWEDISQ